MNKCVLLMPKRINSDFFLVMIGIVSILPFLLITYYNHPSADDFCYFSKSRDLGFWNAQIDWYREWTGRYFSTAILSLGIFRDQTFFIYKFFPVVLLVGLFFSLRSLGNLLFENSKKKHILLFSLFCTVAYIVQMPSISQGLYWLAGSVTYQLSNILVIIVCCFVIRLLRTNRVKELLFVIVFTGLAIGTNETSMLITDFLLGTVVIYNYLKFKKTNYSLLVLLFFAIVFSVIVIQSPGNEIRGALYPNRYNFIYSFVRSISLLVFYAVKWLPLTLLLFLIYSDVFKSKHKSFSKIVFDVHPFWVGGVVFGVLFIGFFTGHWSMGSHLPLRTLNTICIFCILGFIYLFFVLYFKIENSRSLRGMFSSGNQYLYYVLAASLLLQNTNIITAYKDLFSGDAYRYNITLRNRYKIIDSALDKKCDVPKLDYKPETLFFGDITNDSHHWKNECHDAFWQKSVRLKE